MNMKPALMFLYLLMVVVRIPEAGAIDNLNLALVINRDDPQSVELGRYYQQMRLIPERHIIYVSIKNPRSSISADAFDLLYRQVQQQTDEDVQAYALAWSKPYKVACMSITSAMALGFNKKYCAVGCKTTAPVAYFNSSSRQPFRDLSIRPAIMLAGESLEKAKKTIRNGVLSDYSRPSGSAYLVSTTDKERNVRAFAYRDIVKKMSAVIDVHLIEGEYIENRPDVMFYFTGLKQVRKINSNHFLPGAVADHLTSVGGVLFGGSQMSILKWLSAGATGSYGTVIEPCNFLGKFPSPAVMMSHYLNGETLLEAYWKSVAMPGQGVFVGEPLASPYKGCRLKINKAGIFSFAEMQPDNYVMAENKNCRLP